jgi:hypothetical protein
VSTHDPSQRSGADAGQLDVHPNTPGPPTGAQTDAVPLQAAAQAPQFAVLPRYVAQPVPASSQSAYPGAHVYTQRPALHMRPALSVLAVRVQSFSHVPQVRMSSGDAQVPAHRSWPAPHGDEASRSRVASPASNDPSLAASLEPSFAGWLASSELASSDGASR